MSQPFATLRQPRSGKLAALLLAALPLLGSPAVQAMDAQTLRIRSLAATCAHCHGTDGQAVQGEALVRLADLPENYILTQLTAFRTGQRPATIMHQITKGYSQEQLETIAKYFGSQNKK
jgi:cytochrome c553